VIEGQTAAGHDAVDMRMGLERLQFFGTQMFGRTAEVLGKLLHRADVAADRVGRVVAPPEIIQHALTQSSHRTSSYDQPG
jgi:hypothetical protein